MSNFDFVYKNYDNSITQPLKEAEKSFWLNYQLAGNYLRIVFEAICDDIIKKNHLDYLKNSNLDERVFDLQESRLLPTFPGGGQYKYVSKTESIRKPWYDFWRLYGNSCHHPNKMNNNSPIICRENHLLVFEIVHHFFLYDARQKGLINADLDLKYDVCAFPVGDNRILGKISFPNQLSEYEFLTETRTETGTLDNYGIIRIFKKKTLQNNIHQLETQTREHEVYIRINNQLKKMNSCCDKTEILSRMNSQYSDHYIIKYSFFDKPHFLTNDLLKTIPLKSRLAICSKLAVQLNTFHQARVYHRNLNYTCIVLCMADDKIWNPAIIKLEFAKDRQANYTLYKRLSQRSSTEQSVSKYEDKTVAFSTLNRIPNNEEWSNADIYSLGVLFGDILTADVSHELPAEKEELRDAGVPEEIADLILNMCSSVTKFRPAPETVVKTLQNIIDEE